MRSMFLVAMGLAMLTAGRVEAFGGSCAPPCCPPPCPPPPQIQWVEKTVTCYRPVAKERQVEVTCNRVVPREVITPVTRTIFVPETKQVQKTINVCKLVPREVIREVPVCVMVPTPCTDPCTGCTVTVCKPQTVMKQVRCCVLDRVVEQRQVVVPVCTYKPVQQTVQCRRIVCDVIPEKRVCTVRYCEMQPYQTTVRVPVCVAPPPCK